MNKTIGLLLIVVLACGAAHAQPTEYEFYLMQQDLMAQQKVAEATNWIMWTGIVSAIATSLSVVALVWTFAEQRKLTRDQSRALVEIVGARIGPAIAEKIPLTYGGPSGRMLAAQLFFEVENLGSTHAIDLKFAGNVLIRSWDGDREVVYELPFDHTLPVLRAACTGAPRFIVSSELDYGAAWGDRTDFDVDVVGTLTFMDIFNKPRTQSFSLYGSLLREGPEELLRWQDSHDAANPYRVT